jgi:predicted signal transduction protein with EAL and GGDEF domain
MIDKVNKNLLAGYQELANEQSVRLLRGIAQGGRSSDELKLLLDSQGLNGADFQAFALTVTGQSVEEKEASKVFEALRNHSQDLERRLGRAVGLRTAALDLSEGLEAAFGVGESEGGLSYTELSNMAFNDPLTGLHNYRYFSMRFNEEIQRAERYHHPVSLIMFDIDHFKRFNDTHGHPAGNIFQSYFYR